eukprot:s266_g22.t1
MALPHRQVDLRHLFVGGLDRRRSKGRKGVLTLPGPALPKHLRLTGLVERLKEIFSEKPVEIPDDAAVVAESPRSVVVPSAEKKLHGPCRGLVMTAREVRHVGESQPLQAILEPDDLVPPPPQLSLLPAWEPVTLEALEDAQEENPEEGDEDVAPTSSAASESPKSPSAPMPPAGKPEAAAAAWSRWRHMPTRVEEVAERPPELSAELPADVSLDVAEASLASPGSSCEGGANALENEGDQDIISRSVSFDSSTTALPRNQQEGEPLHSVYSSPRKITLIPRNPQVDLPPLQACPAQADEASLCPAQTAPGPPGSQTCGGGAPGSKGWLSWLAIPVIKYGSGFAVPALSVKSEVVFLSNEEVGARTWWRRFRAQGDSDASTTDPASDSGDRETHVDDHFSNDHSDSGSAPVTAGTSEAALTKHLGMISRCQQRFVQLSPDDIALQHDWSHLGELAHMLQQAMAAEPTAQAINLATQSFHFHHCFFCSQTFPTLRARQVHMRHAHDYKLKHSCSVDLATDTVTSLPYCQYCDLEFDTWKLLQKHMAKHVDLGISQVTSAELARHPAVSIPAAAQPVPDDLVETAAGPSQPASMPAGPVSPPPQFQQSQIFAKARATAVGARALQLIHAHDWTAIKEDEEVRAWLSTHCAVCNIAVGGLKRMNMHMRQHHQPFIDGLFQTAETVLKRCGTASPCEYCGKDFQVTHLCPAIIQVSMVLIHELPLAADPELPEPARPAEMMRPRPILVHDFVLARDSLDGGPQCGHCRRSFATLNGLKLHITLGK